MAKNKTHTDTVNQLISSSSEYFRISRAAEELGCSTDDLLHLGATGNAEIMAPVVAKGIFEWPEGYGDAFPELDDPIQREFGAIDRVILSKSDLATIEAIEWVIPTSFYAPAIAREAIAYLKNFMSASVKLDSETHISKTEDQEEATNLLKDLNPALAEKDAGESFVSFISAELEPWIPDGELIPLREMYFNQLWHAVSSVEENSARTTINHLFISKKELERLANGLPQEKEALDRNKQTDRPLHGNAVNNAITRMSVLKAAIYCKENWPNDCQDNRKWTETIETNAHLFWPSDGEPPLATETIERLLGEARKLPAK